MDSGDKAEKLRGIVRRVDPSSKPSGGDIEFSPDFVVTSTTDGGGHLLTNVEVILCFWGSFWSQTPPPSPSSADYQAAIEGIVTGSYMVSLGQYRGVGPGTVIYTAINASTDPANGYTDADVVAMLRTQLQTTAMPAPAAGHNRLYAVILPTGITNTLSQYGGQHQSFSYNGVTGYYAWVENTGSLTGAGCVTKIFSHELVEACTNPNTDTSNDGILVNGGPVGEDEIGDACNNQFATVNVNGIECTVQAYWSKTDNVCMLPFTAGDNYEGLWWAFPPGSESGWGINLAHQGDVIFLTWFTYDANGKAWWLSMTANKTAQATYGGEIYRSNGEPFFSGFTMPGSATAVGTGTLSFNSPTRGAFSYKVSDGANVAAQTKAIVLQSFGPLPTCVWGRQTDLTTATNFQDLWWAAPAGSQPGWGVNLTQQGTTIFATWFTYDAGFNPLWLSATAAQTGPKTYAGTLYRTNGPAFGSIPFDPTKVRQTAVGTATFSFSNGNNGSFAYNVDLGDGVNKANLTKAITRQVFRAPGTVCQ
ncbi:MAG TPA: hypothetical protein VG425_07930 [Casimicrobiaceae bacterium]|nr:hypothetical protein [Casimicrobiaceae bacterium]